MAEIWVDLILNRKNLTLTIIVIEFVLFPSPSPHTLTEFFLHVDSTQDGICLNLQFFKIQNQLCGQERVFGTKKQKKGK